MIIASILGCGRATLQITIQGSHERSCELLRGLIDDDAIDDFYQFV
jgi:hypothetical protein